MKTPLERAYNWARRAYARRRSEPLLFEHCSHTAAKVMEEAEKRFDLPTHGVEGFNINMDSSVQYLNTGDTYGRTIIFKSFYHNSGR